MGKQQTFLTAIWLDAHNDNIRSVGYSVGYDDLTDTNETGRIVSSSIPNDYDDRDGLDDGFLTDGESGYILDEELDSDYNWYNTIIGRLLLLFGYSRNDVVNSKTF